MRREVNLPNSGTFVFGGDTIVYDSGQNKKITIDNSNQQKLWENYYGFYRCL